VARVCAACGWGCGWVAGVGRLGGEASLTCDALTQLIIAHLTNQPNQPTNQLTNQPTNKQTPQPVSFVWLVAMMRTQFALTMEFVSHDVEGRGTPLPSAESPHWDRLVAAIKLSEEQLEESCASYAMSSRCKVRGGWVCTFVELAVGVVGRGGVGGSGQAKGFVDGAEHDEGAQSLPFSGPTRLLSSQRTRTGGRAC